MEFDAGLRTAQVMSVSSPSAALLFYRFSSVFVNVKTSPNQAAQKCLRKKKTLLLLRSILLISSTSAKYFIQMALQRPPVTGFVKKIPSKSRLLENTEGTKTLLSRTKKRKVLHYIHMEYIQWLSPEFQPLSQNRADSLEVTGEVWGTKFPE